MSGTPGKPAQTTAHAIPAQMPIQASPSQVALRSYFSPHLIWSARHLSRLVGEIERAPSDQTRFDAQHRAYVISSIVASCGFLEAVINELYQGAFDELYADPSRPYADPHIAPLAKETRRSMAVFWEHGGERRSPLDKYQALLEFTGHPPLDKGSQPYQDANLLVDLRNLIVHFQPKTLPALKGPPKIENQLKGKFPDNQLAAGSGSTWWPDHCLGYGCTEWAHTTARAFADHVVKQAGVQPNYLGTNFGPP